MGTEEKKRLRTEARALREGLGAAYRAQADEAIAARVTASEAFSEAPLVLAYCSVGSEVDTRALIREALRRGKVVALPRVVPGTRTMTWHAIGSLADAAPGFAGIPEPADDAATRIDATAVDKCALALVPGLIFDTHGFRLGYGGGFYDTFLSTFPGRSLGLIRERQLIDDLEKRDAREPFDRPVGLVATEGKLLTIL
ncbi:5-formyltetrahydrofolate cyclo-ligase [uncultured Adlercreutzia sp.]|uniref:5-formyltetrahydrofolate cyclo-ligase n=1 Tax=uncultured Adlercreutzia sp. TaxID=875803 RepID=UPI0026774E10|nr:5-formyltetrahydrofolate cyclo-ligase [uncultured Adlercreutzia sp.]